MGMVMLLKSGFKIALLAGAVIGLSLASSSTYAAKKMTLPPGACAFEKKAVNTGTTCSYSCDANNWCSVQTCTNGQWTQAPIGCWGNFCWAKC
jgi:hypothetical protein